GGRIAPAQVESLSLIYGIRRVVDLRVEDRDDAELFGRHGIAFLHLPSDDARAVSQHHLDAGVEWIGAGLARGQRGLVPCQPGIGGSALLTGCVLVAGGLDAAEALARVKEAREVVSPTPPQLEALLEWTSRNRPDRLVGYDALARIAYGDG